jgi:hypothetical protein
VTHTRRVDTRPGAAGRALLGFGVDIPSPFTRVQQRVLAVTVGALSALAAAAALVVGVLSRSYVWGLATALGGSAATAAILLSLTRKWRDTNAATGR